MADLRDIISIPSVEPLWLTGIGGFCLLWSVTAYLTLLFISAHIMLNPVLLSPSFYYNILSTLKNWKWSYSLQYSQDLALCKQALSSSVNNYWVQLSPSVVSNSATPWTAACRASLSINSQSPPKPMSIESVMPSNRLILCRPLLLLPSIFPSIRVFSNESTLPIRWPKYWSFSFNISPAGVHPGLISFRID